LFVKQLFIGFSIRALREVNKRDDSFIVSTVVASPFFMEKEHEEFNKLVFDLNISGKALFFNKVRSITLNEDHAAILLKNNKVFDVHFEECLVTDTENLVVKCSSYIGEKKNFLVYDWFTLDSIDFLPTAEMNADEPFMKKIWFDVPGLNKVCISKSFLTQEQLNSLEYSDTYAKFKLINRLVDLGHLGRKNGFDNSGNQIHLNLDLNCYRRDIFKRGVSLYEDTEKVRFFDEE